ncbi:MULTISPECIES: serine aminopeptidase domain-containing protein [Burkholderia cepacia complex]|uniref:serine aminopeptidase domain-containing protein n=1 Tax=Burkholderia cepacia complex TaxID=87882 RepID=UPI0018FEB0BE|nr:alpha/beta hydrolase [Burkholderia metallica]
MMIEDRDMKYEWVHIAYDERARFAETYGFTGSQGKVNLEGMLIHPRDLSSKTLTILMHPSSTLNLLPVPRAFAQSGMHVLCAGSRYPKNDTALIMEKVVLDLGAYVRHAKEVWGYEKVILLGWSGGGALSLFYQSQAESPTLTDTPAGDPVDLKGARLIPADAVIFQSAHAGRALNLAEVIDPSVRDESNPDDRDVELDIYDPRNPNQPPYAPEYVARYRAAQLARVRRITAWVKETLSELKRRKTGELERGFVVHRTWADLRFLDPALDPNDRTPGGALMGNPETVNSGPIGLARFSTLRSWLSQWSLDDSRANGFICAARINAPLLVIEGSADDGVPQPDSRRIFEAAGSMDKSMHVIKGATHYYANQPEQIAEATEVVRTWLAARDLL